MKVLLISHTVLSQTNNMGKTLMSYFNNWDSKDIAQFYIHSEVPTNDLICQNYYRFTDMDAMKSIFIPSIVGEKYDTSKIKSNPITTRTDNGIVRKVYIAGSKRKSWSMALRETIWCLSHWETKELRKWIKNFNPDIIFLASGDYAFIYNIAYKISNYLNKPLVVSCVDDFYFYNRNENSLLGRWIYKYYMKVVYKTMKKTTNIFTICDSMNKEYTKLFGKTCQVLHTASEERNLTFYKDSEQISYIGNLGFNRYKQLIDIGRKLKNIKVNDKSLVLDVYSGVLDEKIIKELTIENGIRFHGQISSEEVLEVMKKSMLIIHTESFDEEMKKLVKFSVSTKIASSLMYGPCLIAYGPQGIASIDYLKENEVAYVITSPDELESGLIEVISDSALRDQIIENARKLAYKNHRADINSENLKKWLKIIVEKNCQE